MKKTISLLVALIMCLTVFIPTGVFAAGGTANYEFGNVTAEVGDVISVPVKFTSSGAVNSIGLAGFTYDKTVLEFVEFAEHDAIDAKASLKTWMTTPMQLVNLGLNASETFNGTTLFVMKFKVLAEGTATVTAANPSVKNNSDVFTTTVTAGTVTVGSPVVATYTVTFKAEGAEDIVITKNVGETLAVADFPAVPAKDGYTGKWDVETDITEEKTVNAIYTVIPVYGDVDGDGAVTNLDLMVLERYLAAWDGYAARIVEANCDVDADGDITTADIAVLARHRANWVGYETLPCEEK